MTKTKSILATLALVGVTAGGSLAHAADISQTTALSLTGNTAHFGRDLTAYSVGDLFTDRFTFTTASLSNFVGGVIHVSPGAGPAKDIDITDLSLYNSLGLVVGGVSHGNGAADVWTIKSMGPLAADNYYLQVSGTVLSADDASYAGHLTLAPVPEPATYGMMLGGLGVLGFLARRRKNNQA
ncbi:FxDxF family PEP-CTERM protein [Pseudoduganella sp. UC29_71]|uniref:FxDxF family PEP-CTERM protein n=1 Tax=Pseudoduganella sp. UC29_71 TaxID=3350174 RepID=UPI00366A84B7